MDKPWLKFYDKGVPHSIEIPKITLAELWNEAVQKNPQGVAVTYFGKKLTYQQMNHYTNQLVKGLARLGVKQGERVAIILPNIPQYVMAHFAALKLGAILVPTNPLYVERELKYQLNDSEVKIAIVLDLVLPRLLKIKDQTSLKDIIVTGVHDFLPTWLKFLYPLKAKKEGKWVKVSRRPHLHLLKDILSEDFPNNLPTPDVKHEDIAMFLYTGGTTGISKGAILTHRNLVSNALQIRSWYTDLHENNEVILCALPFFHSYGLTSCLHFAVILKSNMILIPNPRDIKKILQAIQKYKVTLFSAVPTLYVAINNFPEVQKYNLTSVKACISGGAPLPLEVAKKFESLINGRLVEGYGLSEASPVTHANPILGKRKEGSIGLPLPNTEAMVVDSDTGKPLPTGETGELIIKGPQVMQGYWNKKEETRKVLKNGWLYTGDMAKVDEDGYFYIVDRKKDMIIAGGYNIFPREIEEVLYEHPKVQEAAVIGVPDEYRGETVKAFIVCKQGENATEEEIVQFCKQRLAAYKVPKMIEFRDELPKSNIGKILRRVLVEEEKQKISKTRSKVANKT